MKLFKVTREGSGDASEKKRRIFKHVKQLVMMQRDVR